MVIEGSSNLCLQLAWHTSTSPLELSYEIHLETRDHILRNPHVILKVCPFIYLQLNPLNFKITEGLQFYVDICIVFLKKYNGILLHNIIVFYVKYKFL